MVKFTCQFCGKELSTKYNLDVHLKNARYCISKRGDIETSKINKCDYCESTFSTPQNLKRHLRQCTDKKISDLTAKFKLQLKDKDEENSRLRSQVRRLEKECKILKENTEESKDKISELDGIITGLKTAPDKKTIYNTAIHPKLVNLPINNIPALTHEYMIEKVNDGILTYEKAAKGYSGILGVICDLITHENEKGEIERNYVCTDVSRNSFHRLLESKKWKPDKGGRYLNTMLNTFRSVIGEYKNQVYNSYDKTSHDSIEWSQVDWERKNISLLFNGIMCNEGKQGRDELVNILRIEISKRASV